jgi:glycosyltransferase involved in cell wall biosynthesis
MNKISFCINTAKNELAHLKLLFSSLQQNLSSIEHEILVFIDNDNQGTFDWLLTQKDIFPNLRILKNNLPIPYGYQRNINELFKQASNDIVSYIQSDMVICKDYDIELLKRLEPNTILCSTRIEPPLHGNSGEKIVYDFGTNPSEFDLKSFTAYAEEQKREEYTEYFFAPFTLYKEVWNSIGGHDTQFRRSREDSDILVRLVLNGVVIKQTWSALVYHFTCTSSRGLGWHNPNNTQAQQRAQLQQIADTVELGRFITKWGDFYHNSSKVKCYSVDAHITGSNLNLATFMIIQSHFHRVYVDDVQLIKLAQEWYDRSQIPANQLLDISIEDWHEYGYLFNQLKAADRIKPATAIGDSSILVKFNLEKVTPQLYQEFIAQLQPIIDSTDGIGTYQYELFDITISDKVDRALNQIVVTNPEIKPEHLYTIH